jgi:hypothetical protein
MESGRLTRVVALRHLGVSESRFEGVWLGNKACIQIVPNINLIGTPEPGNFSTSHVRRRVLTGDEYQTSNCKSAHKSMSMSTFISTKADDLLGMQAANLTNLPENYVMKACIIPLLSPSPPSSPAWHTQTNLPSKLEVLYESIPSLSMIWSS